MGAFEMAYYSYSKTILYVVGYISMKSQTQQMNTDVLYRNGALPLKPAPLYTFSF